MKKYFIVIIYMFINIYISGQKIQSFKYIKEKEDSISIIYYVRVKFNSSIKKNQQLELVKEELKKMLQVKADQIYVNELFIDKHYRTYRYRIKILKYE
jgi:uncharacterized alkaline shock family protein YloU